MKLKCIFCVIMSAIFATLAFANVEHTKDKLELVKSRVESKEAILVDVREQEEWNDGHLVVATFLPLSKLKALSENASLELPKDKTIYVHCRSGKRALAAAQILQEKGYKDVRPLSQGFSELASFGFKQIK